MSERPRNLKYGTTIVRSAKLINAAMAGTSAAVAAVRLRSAQSLPLLGRRRGFHGPFGVGSAGMIDEEDPGAIGKFPVHLHSVMMYFRRVSVFVLSPDQPLRARRREVAGNGVMRHHVHMRLHIDVCRHRFANAIGSARALL